jgi:hypothetical protein
MKSVIEVYRRTYNNAKENEEGDVLGLIRVLYPDVEYNFSTVKKLLNNKKAKDEYK